MNIGDQYGELKMSTKMIIFAQNELRTENVKIHKKKNTLVHKKKLLGCKIRNVIHTMLLSLS